MPKTDLNSPTPPRNLDQPLTYYEPICTDEQIEENIRDLKAKRNSGKKLCDKEIIELARLIRTLASRKYR